MPLVIAIALIAGVMTWDASTKGQCIRSDWVEVPVEKYDGRMTGYRTEWGCVKRAPRESIDQALPHVLIVPSAILAGGVLLIHGPAAYRRIRLAPGRRARKE